MKFNILLLFFALFAITVSGQDILMTINADDTLKIINNEGGDIIVNFSENSSNNLFLGKTTGLLYEHFPGDVNGDPSGLDNTAIGHGAADSLRFGSGNTALGAFAAHKNLTSSANTAIGSSALRDNLGASNTAVGLFSNYHNVAGNYSTSVGAFSMQYANNSDVTHNSYNSAFGYQALAGDASDIAGNTGALNTAIGAQSMKGNTTGFQNTSVGFASMEKNTSGHLNTAIGTQAMAFNTIGEANTAVGQTALNANTEGENNVAIGASSIGSNTMGHNNTAIGAASMFTNLTGTGNVANGFFALFNNNDGNQNVAIGDSSLFSSTSDDGSVAIGSNSLYNNDGGLGNVAIGDHALYKNFDGNSNVAIGVRALEKNTTKNNNTAIGAFALSSNFDGGSNTALGTNAAFSNESGSFNLAIGTSSLFNNKVGVNNTAIGISAGVNSKGSGNVFIGYKAGEQETGVGSNKLYIHNDGFGTSPLIYGDFSTNKLQVNNQLGIGVLPTNPIQTAAGANCDLAGTWNNASDRRLKKDIIDIEYGLKEIKQLRPVSYKMKTNNQAQVGFIAQEIRDILPELVVGKEGDLESNETLSMSYGNLTSVIVKAVQEQQDIIDKQAMEIALLKSELSKSNEAQAYMKADLAEIKELIKGSKL